MQSLNESASLQRYASLLSNRFKAWYPEVLYPEGNCRRQSSAQTSVSRVSVLETVAKRSACEHALMQVGGRGRGRSGEEAVEDDTSRGIRHE